MSVSDWSPVAQTVFNCQIKKVMLIVVVLYSWYSMSGTIHAALIKLWNWFLI